MVSASWVPVSEARRARCAPAQAADVSRKQEKSLVRPDHVFRISVVGFEGEMTLFTDQTCLHGEMTTHVAAQSLRQTQTNSAWSQ